VATTDTVIKEFQDRRWIVSLDNVVDAAAFEGAVLGALGLQPTIATFEAALARLGEERSLLILDNLETPWEADALAVEQRLQRLAGVPNIALLLRKEARAPSGLRWKIVRVESLPEPAARMLFLDIAPKIVSVASGYRSY